MRRKKTTRTYTQIQGEGILDNMLYVKTLALTYKGKKSINPKLASDRRRIISRKSEVIGYELRQVTPKELRALRQAEVPLFILKKEGVLYCTEIPSQLVCDTRTITGKTHKCVISKDKVCGRFAAKSDAEGGCALIRAKQDKDQIEKFDFITDGFETFNTKYEALAVLNCTNHSC